MSSAFIISKRITPFGEMYYQVDCRNRDGSGGTMYGGVKTLEECFPIVRGAVARNGMETMNASVYWREYVLEPEPEPQEVTA